MIEFVENLQHTPVVGQVYMVPCVEPMDDSPIIDYWPVYSKAHEDKVLLGVDWHHYHVDVRFMSDEQIRYLTESGLEEDVFITGIELKEYNKQMFHRPFICKRNMPEFPVKFTDATDALESKLPPLKISRKGNCMRCPHRNTPLNGLPVRDNVVVCPAHGLAWDVRTGDMVKGYVRDPEVALAFYKARKEIGLK